MARCTIAFGIGVVAGAVVAATGINALSDAITGVCMFFESIDKLATSHSQPVDYVSPSFN